MGPLDSNHAEIDAVHRASIAQSRALGPAMAPRARTPILQFPVRLRSLSKAISGHHIANYVDLDAAAKLKDFTCGRRTYDGHNGTDFVLSPFWWRMMDGKEAEVVAAAPGRLINKNDGNFDRQCNFSGASPGNYVVIEQDDGHFAYYFHMKKGSVTSRSIGSRVAAGDVLGLVGSSGTSLLPHLHFELRTASDLSTGKRWIRLPEPVARRKRCGGISRKNWTPRSSASRRTGSFLPMRIWIFAPILIPAIPTGFCPEHGCGWRPMFAIKRQPRRLISRFCGRTAQSLRAGRRPLFRA